MQLCEHISLDTEPIAQATDDHERVIRGEFSTDIKNCAAPALQK
jgi:hypothetical protein